MDIMTFKRSTNRIEINNKIGKTPTLGLTPIYLLKVDYETMFKMGRNVLIFEITDKGYKVTINDMNLQKFASTKEGNLF